LTQLTPGVRNRAPAPIKFHLHASYFRKNGRKASPCQSGPGIEDLGFARLALGHETLARAAELAYSWGLSAYDSVHAATADLLGGLWLTADTRAHEKIAALDISRLLNS
jgi:hypothetical protein